MGLPISVVVQENYKGGEMKLELFNIVRNTKHWFTFSFGDWFCVWIASFRWHNEKNASIGIRFGNKEYKKYW